MKHDIPKPLENYVGTKNIFKEKSIVQYIRGRFCLHVS